MVWFWIAVVVLVRWYLVWLFLVFDELGFGCLLALVVGVAWVAALVFPALGVFWFASVLVGFVVG